MSSLLPLASYNLELKPFTPQPCQAEDFPVTVRITLASIDPESVDDKNEPSTLRILKKSAVFSDDESDDESDDDECNDDECDGCEKNTEKNGENDDDKNEDEDESDDDDDDDVEDDEAVEEHIICTLSPKTQYQQSLDLTILPDEEVFFVVTGSYTVHLTGNYVEHPNDDDEDDYVHGGSSDEYDSDEYDLTPDEDEIVDEEIDYDLDELDNVEDVEGKIEELVEEDEKMNEKKREAESEQETKSKKAKKEKSVKFNKELEQGPTGPAAEKVKAKKDVPEEKKKSEKKETKKDEKKVEKKDEKKTEKKEEKKVEKKKAVKTLPGGVIIEDKTIGTGPVCKKGQKVGVRYIGKLKNGKVFDKNTSGKPFHFGLGKGEVIKGWDVGVAGMAVGGERRIVIPAPMAYGSQKLPGIPANSELTFDVKLISIK